MVIRPLLYLTGITRLNVHDLRGFDLDDDVVQDMTSAWPSLQSLSTNNRRVRRPKVTLLGFSDLLRKCRQLEELMISIYAAASDITDVKAGVPVPNRSIHTFDLGYSVAEEDVERAGGAG